MLPNKEERDLYYTCDMKGWLQRITIRVFGLILVTVLVSCGIASALGVCTWKDSGSLVEPAPLSRPPSLGEALRQALAHGRLGAPEVAR